MRRAIGALLALLALELALWAVMLADTMSAGASGPDSDLRPVVTDKPATEATTHIVIEGALP
ncbi:hypothetical protein Pcatena_04800 [Parolsenella catena]|uniref:Uncharacterized protein n=1 Tax=Parolsenella catena TaxID=2003188 RepID=A0A3G9JWZ3_9ACTN|nr:hypothetical protein [Parolsenella catena]BBH49893.1 hypothetical protein Pcatena_04800 [Parolsenella catena]